MIVGAGKNGVHLNKIEKILKELNIFSEKISSPDELNSHLSELRKLDYKGTWAYYKSNSHYNFQLVDNSLILFYIEEKKLSYSYIGCPYECPTYEDFLIEYGYTFAEVGESLMSDYLIYLDGCPLVVSPITLRYDFDIESYNEGLHPVSHLHIGFNNQIRIGSKYILDPLAFFCLIIRQIYPSMWLFLLGESKFKSDIVKSKIKIEQIHETFFQTKDNYELYLS